MVQEMISCIFTTAFYAIVIFVDAITNITTIISNLQTNFWFMLRALHRVFQIAVRREIRNFAEGEFFLLVVRSKGGVILIIQTFHKAKTAFCEYCTSIKIKISMTCVL